MLQYFQVSIITIGGRVGKGRKNEDYEAIRDFQYPKRFP